MGLAGLTVFTSITLEGWTDVMYLVSSPSFWIKQCLTKKLIYV